MQLSLNLPPKHVQKREQAYTKPSLYCLRYKSKNDPKKSLETSKAEISPNLLKENQHYKELEDDPKQWT